MNSNASLLELFQSAKEYLKDRLEEILQCSTHFSILAMAATPKEPLTAAFVPS